MIKLEDEESFEVEVTRLFQQIMQENAKSMTDIGFNFGRTTMIVLTTLFITSPIVALIFLMYSVIRQMINGVDVYISDDGQNGDDGQIKEE